MNIKNHTYRWTIDQVLNPQSKFWDKMLLDIEMYLDTLETEDLEALGTEPFTSKISDFISFFKTKAYQKQITEEIERAENVVTNVLWNLIKPIDKKILFDNDILYFSDWIDSCPRELLDIYITALSKGDSLNTTEDAKDFSIYDIIKNANVSAEKCNVSIHKGKLILCSTNKDLLDKFKIVMLDSGNRLNEYREDIGPNNSTIHAYIFEIKKNIDE